MKNMLKIATKIGILVILLIFILSYNRVNADSGADVDPNSWKPASESTSPLFDDKVEVILGAMRAIGIIVSVGVLITIGIKTMLASVEEKSHYKEVMPGYIIGALLVFSITTIPSLIYKALKDFNN